jgi:hypothetical protein
MPSIVLSSTMIWLAWPYFSTFPHKVPDFGGGDYWTYIMCFDFLYNFFCETFFILGRIEQDKCIRFFMYITHYSCQILIKLDFSRKNPEKYSNIVCHENSWFFFQNQCIWGKTGSTEHSKGNKTVLEKVATTRTEDGHKQNTKTSTTI